MKAQTRAECLLVIATLLWGLTFPFIRILLAEMDPISILFLRTLLASLVLVPIILFSKDRKLFFSLMPIGFLIASFNFVAYLSQILGLQSIESGRSAFLTNLTVVFVPLLSPVFKRGLATRTDLISCVLAIIGMLLLTNPFGASGFHMNVGDLWTILCALTFSFQIHFLQIAMKKYKKGTLFAAQQVFSMCILSLIMVPVVKSSQPSFPSSVLSLGVLLYLGLIALVLTTLIQSRYQSMTTPERASIIYVLEPVFASFFGYLFLKEKMTSLAFFGGFLMFISASWLYLYGFLKNVFKRIQT